MTRQIYAFSGKRGSGKSTAVKVLLDHGFVDAKFADPLKNMMRAFYWTCGVDKQTTKRKLEGDLKEVSCEWLQGKSPRYAMQMLGTEWRDLIHTELWSSILKTRVNRGDFGDKVAISDYRFPEHEGEALAELGAVTYRIERSTLTDDDEASKHVSETGIKDTKVSGIILNDGTIEDLQSVILELVALQDAVNEVDIDALSSLAEY
jgi:hypothetical protein